jgi:membrane protein DedA with SNARE-associated domain
MLSDIFYGLSIGGGQCPTLFVKISTFVGQSVGQTVGYGIGIAAEFVRHIPKTISKQYRISLA